MSTSKNNPEAPRQPQVEYASYHFRRLYDYSLPEYERWTRKFRFEYKGTLPANRSSRILDLGCGGGRFLYFLQSQGYSNLTGVDTDDAQLAALRNVVDCEAHQANILEYLGSCKERFDLISCHHVIEHLPRDASQRLLRLAFEALAPGGKLILATPNANRPWAGWHMFADLSHDHLYTSSSLREVLEMIGFSSVELRPEGAVPWDLMGTLRWLLWKIWREPYLKFIFTVDNGRGCLAGTKLIVTEGIIAIANRPES